MKLHNIIFAIVATTLATTSILITATADAASVRSLSRETSYDVDGTTYIQVSVKCSGISNLRVISRAGGQNTWCLKDSPDSCYSGKIRAARKVCSNRTRKSGSVVEKDTPSETPVAEAAVEPVAEPAPVASAKKVGPNGKTRAELMKEYIQIEEQRILVEQQKIELNRRELELQRRELAL